MLDSSNEYHVTEASAATLDDSSQEGATVPSGLIGPNSVIQLQKASIELLGEKQARQVFLNAKLPELFDTLPTSMIDEAVPKQLFETLYQMLPYAMARRVALRAGELTAEYIIANRIPAAVKICLKFLPPSLSAALLLTAIQRNAWTFVGSGRFQYEASPYCLISIADNPLSMPACAWHVAVFQRLFSRLVCSESRVKQLNSCAAIPDKDSFVICYGRKFFAQDCKRTRKNKLRYFCSQCVS